MKTIRYAAAFFIMIAFSMTIASCKKDSAVSNSQNNNNNNNNNNNSAASNRYISKITVTDTISSSPTVAGMSFYSYDGQKRLSTIVSYSNGDTVHLLYSYNGNDTIPYSCMRSEATVGTTGDISRDTSVTYFFFDGQGRRTVDSAVNSGVDAVIYPPNTIVYSYHLGYSIQRYSYSSNTMYRDYWDTTLVTDPALPSYAFGVVRDTATLDADGDIISSHEYYGALWIAPTIFYYTDQMTYDNHPSPFARFRKFTRDLFPNSGTAVSPLDVWTTKTLLTGYETIDDNFGNNYGNGPTWDGTGLYEYDSNNLLVKINNSPFFGRRVYLEYVTL